MTDVGSSSQKYPGITSPISLAEPKPFDYELSKKVEEAMRPYGTFESDQELSKRYVLHLLARVLPEKEFSWRKRELSA